MSERIRELDADRRRALNIGTRSRALLDLGADKIAKMENRPPPLLDDHARTKKYEQFHRSIRLVRRLASGLAVYDEGVRMGPVVVTSDPRLEAIADLAELASVTTDQLDLHTIELAVDEDHGLGELEAYMITLPEPEPSSVSRRDRARIEHPAATRACQMAVPQLVGLLREALEDSVQGVTEDRLLVAIALASQGDARRALSAIEVAVDLVPDQAPIVGHTAHQDEALHG